MTIFFHEWKMKQKSIVIWSLSIISFMFLYMSFFPGLSDDGDLLKAAMEGYSEDFLAVLGIKYGLSVTSLAGYFSLTFSMMQLALAIQGANYGFAILSDEEREGTADFLLTKPIRREQIFWNKLAASVLSLLFTTIIVGIGIVVALALFSGNEGYDKAIVLKIILTIPFLQLVFFSIGLLISTILKKIRSVISFSMGLVIALYVINGVGSVLDDETMSYLSPFYYFEAGYIFKHSAYDNKLLLIAAALIVLSVGGSHLLYCKRDVHSV